MYAFLLDTCVWSNWFGVRKEHHVNVKRHIQKLPSDSILGISIISWGEVFYGHKANSLDETPIQAGYIQFIKSKRPKTFEIDIHTAHKYGELRALLFDKYAPSKRKSGLHPEQLIDPITSNKLGIQENDLWIAAQAMVRNMILVTNDKLTRISEVAGDGLHIESWTT